jgi:hypothetical protein
VEMPPQVDDLHLNTLTLCHHRVQRRERTTYVDTYMCIAMGIPVYCYFLLINTAYILKSTLRLRYPSHTALVRHIPAAMYARPERPSASASPATTMYS